MLLSVSIMQAQTAPETLTNAKVVSMVKAALPKVAIIKSIENKQGNFDTSTEAMIALKKQGVSDDVITAMVSKTSSHEPVRVEPSVSTEPAAGKHEYAVIPKSKECDVTTSKNNVGQVVTMVKSPTKQGNFLLAKEDGKMILIYNTKVLLAELLTDTRNVAILKIDSVRFIFEGNNIATLKTTVSSAKLPNINREMKPHITNAQYNLYIPPGSKAETWFKQSKLLGFQVVAERDGQYADLLNEKQQAKLIQAFNCIP
jgi:hypothetical protein